jgi:acetoin utilization deacetylase AcuC-like enzyme
MNPWSRLKAQAARLMRGPLPTFYDPAYRIPIASLEQRAGMALRRADFAAWTLADLGLLRENDLRTPRRVSWGELALVHSGRLLESLTQPETLAQIFAVRVEELYPDEVLHTLRLAVGATVDAAREAL